MTVSSWKYIAYWALAFTLIVGRRVLANYLARSHPGWSPEKVAMVRAGLALIALLIFGVAFVAMNRP
jgi:hypothetical protein